MKNNFFISISPFAIDTCSIFRTVFLIIIQETAQCCIKYEANLALINSRNIVEIIKTILNPALFYSFGQLSNYTHTIKMLTTNK